MKNHRKNREKSNGKNVIAVRGIKRQHLVEVRSMSNPPLPVKLALESICFLLGESALDWKTIRGFVARDNFVPTIVNFNVDGLP